MNERTLRGVCSTYLADRVRAGERVRVFPHASKHFGLPPSGDTSIVMIGPGTGVAPFRAFLHDCRASGARGRNWLFFGDQRRDRDFLYRDELRSFKKKTAASVAAISPSAATKWTKFPCSTR